MTRRKRVIREVSLFVLFLLIAIAMTWPMARNLRTALSDLGDPVLNTFLIDWDVYALTHKPLQIYNAPFYAPGKYPLAYSENMIAIGLVMVPFRLIGLAPVTLYNVAMLLGFALAGYGMSVLARVCGRSIFASIIAGIFFAFCSFKFDHLSHLQIIWSGWLPLMFAALFTYWREPTRRHAVFLGIAFVMNALTNIHWLLFGSFTLAVTIVFLAIVERRDRRYWTMLIATLAISSAIVIPFLIPYRVVSKTYGMKRAAEEVAWYSAKWGDWLRTTPRNLLYGWIPKDADSQAERKLFPGAVPIVLALAALLLARPREELIPPAEPPPRVSHALIRTVDVIVLIFAFATYIGATADKFEIRILHHRFVSIDNASSPAFFLVAAILLRLMLRLPPAFGGPWRTLRDLFLQSRFTAEEWSALIWIGIGVLGSLGLNAVLHGFLYRNVEAFRSLRVPARWAIIAYIGIAVWSAFGIDRILRAKHGLKWSAIASAIVVLAFADVSARVRWEQMIVEPSPVYRWLADAGSNGLVLELPMSGWNTQFMYLFGSTTHHVPIMNGTSGFEPPVHENLRNMAERGEINDVFLAELERNRCELVVVHADWLFKQKPATMQWLREQLANGRLAFVRRFDHWVDGDYVFAVTSVAKDWQRWRAPQVPDAAGFTPDQELARFLRDQPTYNASTFFHVDMPRSDEEHHGPLRVAGWALAPSGVETVRVFLNGGTKIYDATFTGRADVQWRWPWYPKSTKAGFECVLPKRPKRMHREVGIQVEFTDREGKVTMSPYIPVNWD
jgi:hypothetical protein